jgi:uncharacterized membrane protein YkvA (DUF1232 family)
MRERLREAAALLRRELAGLVLRDARTPRAAKLLLGLAVAYTLSPIDLIPDFIPVLGQLDDALIVPALVLAALRMVPDEVVTQARAQAQKAQMDERVAEA